MMIGQEEDSEQQFSDFVVEDNYNLKGKGVSGAQKPTKRLRKRYNTSYRITLHLSVVTIE
jgi:hypothetical protein